MSRLAHHVRSLLYVPGDRPELVQKALRSHADAVIIDTEDGVAPSARRTALEHATATLAENLDPRDPEVWVRLHPELAPHVGDLAGPRLRGFVVPLAEDPDFLAELARKMEDAVPERRTSEHRQPALLPLIESGRGLRNLDEICGASRVLRLGMGEADLSADLGLDPSDDEREFLPIRVAVVAASAAARLAAPIGSTSTNFNDLGRLRVTTKRLLRLGFRSRTAIHPAQVGIINEVFTPSADEVTQAEQVLDAFEALRREGRGTGIAADGTMIDEAVVQSARDILRRASR